MNYKHLFSILKLKHIYLKRVLHGGIPGTLTIKLKDILHYIEDKRSLLFIIKNLVNALPNNILQQTQHTHKMSIKRQTF